MAKKKETAPVVDAVETEETAPDKEAVKKVAYRLTREVGRVIMPGGREVDLSKGLPEDAAELYEKKFPYIEKV